MMQLYSHRPHRRYTSNVRPPLQAELTDLHHQSLLREQAELERYYDIHCGPRSKNYEAQIMERQIRIADLLRSTSRIQWWSQSQFLLESQLQYQQMLREMELKSYLKQSRLDRISKELNKEQTDTSQQFNSQRMQINEEHTKQKQKLMSQYDVNSQKRTQSWSLPQTKYQECREQQQETHNRWQNRSNIIKAQNNKSPTFNHRKNISYSYDPRPKAANRSRSVSPSPSPLRPKTHNKNMPKQELSASQLQESSYRRISERLTVSKTAYKDSAWSNLKHETTHLFSTFDNQTRLRRQLKTRINKTPSIIEKYSIVVD